MKTIVSIDPGSKGFISVLYPDGKREFFAIEGHTHRDVANFIMSINPENTVCVMEEVHAIKGSAAGATFSFGEIFGFLKGVITASGFAYHLVQPKEWQSKVWINEDKVYKYGKPNAKTGKCSRLIETKATSINAAKRLFPEIDFKRTPKCINLDDNKVDSVLIGEYARRENL